MLMTLVVTLAGLFVAVAVAALLDAPSSSDDKRIGQLA